MALDRQDIERRDFPIGRRGYETEAVDAHLRRLADEIEELKQADKPSAASLSGAASEQVRAIVEAAEATAADIRRQAETEAEKVRAQAAEEARSHVVAVQEATQVMLARVEAMESELGAVVESLRTQTNRLIADLDLLQGDVGDLRGATTRTEEPEPAAEPEPEIQTEVAGEPSAPAGGDDSEGARLIALNMALNGTPRDETDRYLAENFQLDDRGKLLDEVYARVG
jgi:DivIVA domain-containing protein